MRLILCYKNRRFITLCCHKSWKFDKCSLLGCVMLIFGHLGLKISQYFILELKNQMIFLAFLGFIKDIFESLMLKKIKLRSSKVQIIRNMTIFEAYSSLKCPILFDAGPFKRRKKWRLGLFIWFLEVYVWWCNSIYVDLSRK